jgi:hypothetical protein
MGELKQSEEYWVANGYIGVSEGYLGDFTYRSHREFYPAYCDLNINPDILPGTTRERFLHILAAANAQHQAAILRGVAKKYPPGSASHRTKAAASKLAQLIARCSDTAAVASSDPKISSEVVKRALSDASDLIIKSGATSAVDRIHTALHGYLKVVCTSEAIPFPTDASMTDLFKLIRQHHPRMTDLGAHQEAVLKVLKPMTSILDAMNPARNRGSLAHPNDELLGEPEAILFINAARTILQYLDTKLATAR